LYVFFVVVVASVHRSLFRLASSFALTSFSGCFQVFVQRSPPPPFAVCVMREQRIFFFFLESARVRNAFFPKCFPPQFDNLILRIKQPLAEPTFLVRLLVGFPPRRDFGPVHRVCFRALPFKFSSPLYLCEFGTVKGLRECTHQLFFFCLFG